MSKIGPGDLDWGEAIDAAVFDAFTKRVMMPISNHPAFKMGLIDGNGNIKKQPRTREEKRALSFLDRLAFLFKRYNAARTFQIFNDYRLARLNPVFLQAVMRASSFRFSRYYDLNFGWEFSQLTEEKKLKLKRKKLIEDHNKKLIDDQKKKKELEDKIQDYFIEMEEQIEETKEGE